MSDKLPIKAFFLTAAVLLAVSVMSCSHMLVSQPLEIKPPTADPSQPQAARMAEIRWTAAASGGIGSYSYDFLIRRAKEVRVVQSGPLPYWDWSPDEPGKYSVKAIVTDYRENTAESGWSPEYEIVPELMARTITADRPAPQAANMTGIKWSVSSSGGVGPHTYEFHLLKDKSDRVVQTGVSSVWDWKPDRAGLYRIRAVVRDTLGNTAESGWSPEYEIVPELLAEKITADRPAPQAANMTAIKWSVKSSGGIGTHTYEFHVLKGEEDVIMQTDVMPYWDWKPDRPGRYRIKAVVRDTMGNTTESGWSSEYEIVPELLVKMITADRPAPQAANMADIKWAVTAAGGVGKYIYEFHVLKDREDRTVQTGSSPVWIWKPDEAGFYKVRTVVRDALGNTADGKWSPEYEIVPELLVRGPSADKTPPQAANISTVRWTAEAAGGVGGRIYEFHLLKGEKEKIAQTDTSPYWDWEPDTTGAFRVKVVVLDSLGNRADSGWSPEYEIRKFIKSSLVAVLPVENLSGVKAPAKKIGQLIKRELRREGFNIIDNDVLEEFMLKHRVRYTGAIDLKTAESFQKEIGVEAVLITSIELYSEIYPPKISLISRLTSTGSRPAILWMDSVGLSGDDSPGILGLGLIEDPDKLLLDAIRALSADLDMDLWGAEAFSRPLRGIKRDQPSLIISAPESTERMERPSEKIKSGPPSLVVTSPDRTEKSSQGKKPNRDDAGTPLFGPKIFYRSPILSSDMKYRVAIMPFLNKSERKNAGDIMTLHFTEQLREIMNYDVIEPGIVRNNLLGFRIIMNEGISFENAGFIFSTLETDADLILSGTVLDYQDNISVAGAPKVDFSVLVIEKKSREIVWTSKSYRTGDEGVIFFDKGKINVAHSLASGMARGIAEMLLAD
ncbi:MAG: hypothetical protein AB1499_01085 [Nitrospirota bacterium]